MTTMKKRLPALQIKPSIPAYEGRPKIHQFFTIVPQILLGAVAPHAGICAEDAGKLAFLPRPLLFQGVGDFVGHGDFDFFHHFFVGGAQLFRGFLEKKVVSAEIGGSITQRSVSGTPQ
jgi:hypothetical protein